MLPAASLSEAMNLKTALRETVQFAVAESSDLSGVLAKVAGDASVFPTYRDSWRYTRLASSVLDVSVGVEQLLGREQIRLVEHLRSAALQNAADGGRLSVHAVAQRPLTEEWRTALDTSKRLLAETQDLLDQL